MLKKCDILIPIYNAPEWVKLCVYSLIINTPKEYINKIYLLDDNSNEYTKNCLKNLKNKYGNIIEIITNKTNMGFVKNCNNGMKLSMKDKNSECVLLLNTDCLVSKNTVNKLMQHVNKNENIGLICPISSNAANLTFEMFEGFNFNQMNDLLEKKFKGINFDACTVVGNCLMITKKCIEKVGYLDEIFGMGYGEETDYHFRSLSMGFEAKVAIDTYVFHKSEVSFGTSKEKQERLNKNREIFFSRWRKEYNRCIKEYEKNDPIGYINSYLTEEDKEPTINTLFYLPDIVQNAGGCHVITDLVNYMTINGYNANILFNNIVDYKEIMVFNPVSIKKIDNIKFKQIISTVWASVYPAYKIAEQYKVPLLNFVQGYEPYFENGNIYGLVELTYKLSDANLVISKYLQKKLKKYFDAESYIIPNSIHYDLLKRDNINKKIKTFTFILRGNPMKGDFVLLDIIKMIDKKYKNLKMNIVYMNPYIEFPYKSNNNEIVYIKGPLERSKIHSLLGESDIYVDASINEGFGLTALEAMTAGAIPIVSNSFGIHEYMVDSQNGFIIKEINDAEKYLEKIDDLMNNNKLYLKMKKECSKTVDNFDYDNKIHSYIDYFKNSERIKYKSKKLSKEEMEIIEIRASLVNKSDKTKSCIYKFNKFIPNRLKNILKRIITTMYNSFQH